MYTIIQKLENIESMLQYNPDYRASGSKRQRSEPNRGFWGFSHKGPDGEWTSYPVDTAQEIGAAFAQNSNGGTISISPPFEVRWGSEATSSKMKKTPDTGMIQVNTANQNTRVVRFDGQESADYFRDTGPLTEAEIQEIADSVYEDNSITRGISEVVRPDRGSTKEEVLRAYLHQVRNEKKYKIAEAVALYNSFMNSLRLIDKPSYFERINSAGQQLLRKWKFEGLPTINEILKDYRRFKSMQIDLIGGLNGFHSSFADLACTPLDKLQEAVEAFEAHGRSAAQD